MRPVNPIAINSYPVRSGMTIYYGALVGISTVGVTDGRLVNWSSASGALRFCGIAQPTQQVSAGSGTSGQVTGNAAGTIECPVSEGGIILENVSVTGLSANQNVGDPVFATDENTFTLTQTSNVGAVGVISRYITGTRGDIQLYSKMEYNANENVGKV
jgi:hypothetical protein